MLLAFLESHQERHLLKAERTVPEHFEVYFTAPCDEMPKLTGLNFDATDAFAINRSKGNDTLSYWIKDTTLVHQDTLWTAYTYLETDTLGQLIERTDTISFVSKILREKQLKLEAEQRKKWQKEQDKLKKKGLPYQEEMPAPELELKMAGNTNLAPDENIIFETKEPIASIDTSKIHLLLKVDSTYAEADYLIENNQNSLFRRTLYAEWRPQQEYRLVVDSAAFIGIYGHASKKQQFNISVPGLETYGSLFLNIEGLEGQTAVVELLNSSDKPQRKVKAENGRAEFFFVKPGTYYIRLFIDRNNNGIWDTGEYESRTQPEDTYYYPSKLELRALWDTEQDWNIHSTPRIKQKPMAITKQKPDKEKTIKNRNAERAKSLGR